MVVPSPPSLTVWNTLLSTQIELNSHSNSHSSLSCHFSAVLMFRAVEGCGLIGFTVNLNVNYRNVIPVGHAIVMRVNVQDSSARKIVANFGIFSPDHTVLYAEGSGIFVKPKE